MVFQDPMTSLNPVFTVGMQIAEVLRRHMGMNAKQAATRAVELLDLVGIANPSERVKQYAARDVGRHASARTDRDGAGLRAGTVDRRRAHHRARRHDPGPDPRADRRLAAAARPGGAVDHARPRRGRRSLRSRRGDVRRQDRRVSAPPTSCTPSPATRTRPGCCDSTPRLDVVMPRLVSIDGAPPDLVEPPAAARSRRAVRVAIARASGDARLKTYRNGRQGRVLASVRGRADA